MTTARLYISHRCFLCRILEPRVRFWFWRRGWALEVYKLRGDTAHRVNDVGMHDASHIPAVPALTIEGVTLVGVGMLKVLRALGRAVKEAK